MHLLASSILPVEVRTRRACWRVLVELASSLVSVWREEEEAEGEEEERRLGGKSRTTREVVQSWEEGQETVPVSDGSLGVGDPSRGVT